MECGGAADGLCRSVSAAADSTGLDDRETDTVPIIVSTAINNPQAQVEGSGDEQDSATGNDRLAETDFSEINHL